MRGEGMMMNGEGMMMNGPGPFMMIVGFLFLVLLTVGIVLLVRWLSNRGRPERRNDALESARNRFARGEISREEFKGIKKTLEET